MDPREQSEQYQIVRCRTGSHAYGMATASSDLDTRGVFAGMPLSVMTPFFRVEQYAVPGEDTILYELSKYVNLVCDQNPNIVELLWVEPSDVLCEHPAWSLLRDSRSELLSRKLRSTYGGYAKDQLGRMKSHSKWLNNPQPVDPPRPCDFVSMIHNVRMDKEFNSMVPREGKWTAVNCGNDTYLLFPGGNGSWINNDGSIRLFSLHDASEQTREPLAAIIKFNRSEYEGCKKNHENYWAWKRNRNESRSEGEQKLGYDTKNGSHLIRLMRTAEEALTEGIIRVRRPDAKELLSIRNGEWSYERLMDVAGEIDARLPGLEEKSSLPKTLNLTKVGHIVMEMYVRVWDSKLNKTVVSMSKNSVADISEDPWKRTI